MKNDRRLLWVLGVCIIISLAACGCTGQNQYSQPPSTTQMPSKGGSTVIIQNFAFVPSNLGITVGTTVTWVNEDAVEHQVINDAFDQTAQGAFFTSGPLQKGASYSFKFTKAGVYTYHCSIHPSMVATITVTS